MEINTILVPVDFSERSSNALEVAAILARKVQAKIIVLHMLGLREALITKDKSEEFMEAKFYMELTKKGFKTFLDKPYLKNLKVHQMVQNYKVFEEVNRIALEEEVDLIVMGSHGTHFRNGFFVGSHTEKVVRTSEVPVLVIKEKNPEFTVTKVVFACDFKVETIPVYQKALRLFRIWEPHIHLVYVNQPHVKFKNTQEVEEEMNTFMRIAHHGEVPHNLHLHTINDHTVEEGLFFFARNVGADLIGISTHGRRGLAHFFQGSIGEDVANHANLPVLTFKM
ncbi:MAG: universal stress protein [Bacteroidota bacterium]